jgi:very-short-patch-repair endonuclease
MAGVLRAGPGAALSHRPAAALVGIRRWVAGDVEVSVAADRRSRSGLRIYRTDLPADEVTIIDGIPVTTVPRTLLDLAAVLKPHQLEAAINEAEAERLTDPLSLADVIERHPRRKGIAAVRAILGAGRIGTTVTRSEFEERVVAFLDSFKLPRPEFNMHVDAGDRLYECDCVWRAERLVVELDGRQTHDTGQAFESDRARDRALQAAGWRVVRITWWQLHHEAATIVAHLRLLLGRR